MISVQQETLFQIADEVDELLQLHYEELTLYKERVALDPIWSRYNEMESAGSFYVFTVRDDGKLVGYSAFFLVPHMHYAAMRMAHNDVIFLRKDYRDAHTGKRLIELCESRMKELGADRITWHVKLSLDWSPLLHRMGYASEEVVVGKML